MITAENLASNKVSDLYEFLKKKGLNVNLYKSSANDTSVELIEPTTQIHEYFYTLMAHASQSHDINAYRWDFIHGQTGTVIESDLDYNSSLEEVFEYVNQTYNKVHAKYYE